MRKIVIKKIAPLIAKFAQNNHIAYVGLFGSEARGEAKKDSDIDMLIELKKPVGFFKFVHLEEQLSKLLKEKVDLQTRHSIDKKIKPFIEKDLITLYEE